MKRLVAALLLTACAASSPSGAEAWTPVDDATPPDAAPPDAAPPVDCVAPTNGACPEGTARVLEGRRLDRERQCLAAAPEVLSCLTEAGLSTLQPLSGCVRRVSDGAEYHVDEGACLPFESTGCGVDGRHDFNADGWPLCPETASTGVCEPRALGLTLSPAPGVGNVARVVESSGVEPDRLTLHVRETHADGRVEQVVYALTGPFAQLAPAALAGLDRMIFSRHFSTGEDFIVTLSGTDRVPFLAVSAHRASLEARFGDVDALFDTTMRCDPAVADDVCPRDLALRWDGLSVPSGRSASAFDMHVRAGRVTGCPGDPDADAFAEFVVLPRADILMSTRPAAPGP